MITGLLLAIDLKEGSEVVIDGPGANQTKSVVVGIADVGCYTLSRGRLVRNAGLVRGDASFYPWRKVWAKPDAC